MSESRATLHLICGLPGSCKTALAKRLEHDLPALRLAPDEYVPRDELYRRLALRNAALPADTFRVRDS